MRASSHAVSFSAFDAGIDCCIALNVLAECTEKSRHECKANNEISGASCSLCTTDGITHDIWEMGGVSVDDTNYTNKTVRVQSTIGCIESRNILDAIASQHPAAIAPACF